MENKKPNKGATPEFDADLHGDVETDSTGKNTLIRDPDASIDTSELEIIDYSPSEQDKSQKEPDPHDPYNSGVFDALPDEALESREWKSKRRR